MRREIEGKGKGQGKGQGMGQGNTLTLTLTHKTIQNTQPIVSPSIPPIQNIHRINLMLNPINVLDGGTKRGNLLLQEVPHSNEFPGREHVLPGAKVLPLGDGRVDEDELPPHARDRVLLDVLELLVDPPPLLDPQVLDLHLDRAERNYAAGQEEGEEVAEENYEPGVAGGADADAVEDSGVAGA